MLTRLPRLRPLLALAAAATLLACADAPPPPAPTTGPTLIEAPHVTDFTDPAWARAAPDDTVLARVAGAPITLAAVRASQAASDDLDARQTLDRLIELEVLAQQAVRLGLDRQPAPQRAWREALGQATLRAFEATVRPEDMPIEQVRAIYAVPKVRQRFDHHDAWNMAYLMLSCCAAATERCDTEEILQCFDESGRVMQEIYTELKALTAPVEPDIDKVDAVMRKYRADNELRWPNFSYREQAFYYDPAKPHEEQKGYDVIAENVARAVTDAPFGVIQPPQQSPFGWHIVMKKAHEPAVHKGPDDPEVAADIRANAMPSYLRARFQDWVNKLVGASGAQTFPERLALLDAESPAADPGEPTEPPESPEAP
ncbi:MAG: hypothetical protein R3F39_16740 [Myxococcota bacterium]